MKQLLVLATLVFSHAAVACDCVPITDDAAFAKAQSVFLATVTEAELIEPARKVRARFTVLEIFKGDPTYVKALESHDPSSDCAVRITIGARYLIFAGPEEVALLGDCGPGYSRHFNAAKESTWLKKHKRPR